MLYIRHLMRRPQPKSAGYSIIIALILCMIAIFFGHLLLSYLYSPFIETFSAKKKSIKFFSPQEARLEVFRGPVIASVSLAYPTVPVATSLFLSPLQKLLEELRPLELKVRIADSSLQNPSSPPDPYSIYAANLVSFSKAEENAIREVIASQDDLSNYDWKFLKKKDLLDKGESYILDDVVCLSLKDSAIFTQTAEEEDDTDNKLGFLIGLLISRLQKTKPADYKKWYEQMNFTEITSLDVSTEIESKRYSDPNVPISEWAYKMDDDYYWMTRVVDVDFSVRTTAFLLKPSGNGFQVQLNERDINDFATEIGVDATKLHHPACVLATNPVVLHADDADQQD